MARIHKHRAKERNHRFKYQNQFKCYSSLHCKSYNKNLRVPLLLLLNQELKGGRNKLYLFQHKYISHASTYTNRTYKNLTKKGFSSYCTSNKGCSILRLEKHTKKYTICYKFSFPFYTNKYSIFFLLQEKGDKYFSYCDTNGVRKYRKFTCPSCYF